MAKVNIYSVYDSKVSAFGSPIFCINDAVAERCLAGVVSDPASVLSKNPGDFTLHRLGSFDDVSGLIEPAVSPVHVCNASAVARSVSLTMVKGGSNE